MKTGCIIEPVHPYEGRPAAGEYYVILILLYLWLRRKDILMEAYNSVRGITRCWDMCFYTILYLTKRRIYIYSISLFLIAQWKKDNLSTPKIVARSTVPLKWLYVNVFGFDFKIRLVDDVDTMWSWYPNPESFSVPP